MIYLLDSGRLTTAVLDEYDSLVTTRRFSEHSSWSGSFPVSNYAALKAAKFCQVQGETELYLVEHAELGKDEEGFERVIASGRSATALLHLRTIEGTMRWASAKPGAMVKTLIESLTGDRAIPGLVFGTGDTLGSAVELQRSWGDMGDVTREILSAATMGCTATLSGTDIVYSVYEPTAVSTLLGDEYGNASSSLLIADDKEWRNYAYVLGEIAADGSRVLVVVDESGTDERRELYVDARDVQSEFGVEVPVSVETNDVFTATAHGFVDGNRVKLSDLSGGTGLANDTLYHVRDATANTFKLSATAGGAAINVTVIGTATVTTLGINADQYIAVLTARGTEKLADTRRIEYVEADTTALLACGSVVWFDADRYSAELMCSESQTVYEKGFAKHSAALGEPPVTIAKRLRLGKAATG